MFAPHGQASAMIEIGGGIVLDDGDFEESFVRASGPGGQNVNKLASAVQLRFDLRRSRALPEAAKERLARLAGRRLAQDGTIVITARHFRTQERNRADARDRLVALIRRALAPPVPRRPTKPSTAARQRRLDAKARRSAVKRDRRVPEEG
jgi:ribosome-associated protein